MIDISATTSGFLSVNDLSCYIKSITPGTMLILGDSHISITPDDIASLENVDGVCIGYGEKPLLQLITFMENGDDYFGTPNFWFRKNCSCLLPSRYIPKLVYKLFGLKSRLSIKHTEPVISFLSFIFLKMFFRTRKVKDFFVIRLICRH